MNCFKHSNVLLLVVALLCIVAAAVCAPVETTTDQSGTDEAKALAAWSDELDKLLNNDLRQKDPRTSADQHLVGRNYIEHVRHLARTIMESKEYRRNQEVREAVASLFRRKSNDLYLFEDELGPEFGYLIRDFFNIYIHF